MTALELAADVGLLATGCGRIGRNGQGEQAAIEYLKMRTRAIDPVLSIIPRVDSPLSRLACKQKVADAANLFRASYFLRPAANGRRHPFRRSGCTGSNQVNGTASLQSEPARSGSIRIGADGDDDNCHFRVSIAGLAGKPNRSRACPARLIFPDALCGRAIVLFLTNEQSRN
jgi:hypothetical protein